jgi:hypothetical protein
MTASLALGQLEQSRFDLRKALSDAAIASEQTELDTVNRALELRKKLDDQDLDPEVRREIGNSLRDAGFSSGASELEIVRRRQAIEEDIAQKRLAALVAEQEYQKRSLQLDLQRQQIAAQTVGYEAEIGVLRAQQAQIEAQGALARAGNDALAKEAAQIQLKIANRQLELSEKQLANSRENLTIQGELADNAIKAQNATHQAALDQANAAESARQQAEGMERAEAAVSRKVESTITPSAAALGDLSDGKAKRKPTLLETARNQLPELRTTTYLPPDQSRHQGLNRSTSAEAQFKRYLGLDPIESAESQFDRSLGRVPKKSRANSFNQDPSSPETEPVTLDGQLLEIREAIAKARTELATRLEQIHGALAIGFNLPKPRKVPILDIPVSRTGINVPATPLNFTDSASMERLAQASKPVDVGQTQTAGFIQFTSGLKEANKDVVSCLRELIDASKSALASPRSLSVSSPSPVSDGARIWSDIARMAITQSGLG